MNDRPPHDRKEAVQSVLGDAPEVDPDLTAFDYLVHSLEASFDATDVAEYYDRDLLRWVSRKFSDALRGGLEKIEFEGGGLRNRRTTVDLDIQRVQTLTHLEKTIPAAQAAMIAGKLDAIRHSDHTFTLIAEEDHQAVRGVASARLSEELQSLWRNNIVVSGIASFTASGGVQSIEAEQIRPASDRDVRLYSFLPEPLEGGALPSVSAKQSRRSGINAIFGEWPGEESEEEILRALDDMS